VDNQSVVGGTLAAVMPDLPQYLSAQPQLVIIAFGMNDHMEGVAGLAAFRTTLETAVSDVEAAGADVLLVGFLQQNPQWVLEDPTQTAAYNQAIADVATEHGVPFVDPRPAFAGDDYVARLLGDYMHHPNDYGQRLYFSLLLPYLLSASIPASSVESYVP
jgi:lysophospholipase L1-like esterase